MKTALWGQCPSCGGVRPFYLNEKDAICDDCAAQVAALQNFVPLDVQLARALDSFGAFLSSARFTEGLLTAALVAVAVAMLQGLVSRRELAWVVIVPGLVLAAAVLIYQLRRARR